MIDRYFIGNKPETEVLFRQEYRPEQVITSSEVVNPGGDNLIVLFPPWHGGGKAYSMLVQRLVNRNNAVLLFAFDDQLLTNDSDQVLESFRALAIEAAKSINNFSGLNRYEKVSLVGASLGTPALAMTASQVEKFDAATLVTPGANLADCMWHGIRTQHVRRDLEAQGETLESIDAKWQPIAPVNHVSAMEGKDVKLVISTTDDVIPARSQIEYAAALVSIGVEPNITKSRLGHYGTIGRFCLFNRF